MIWDAKKVKKRKKNAKPTIFALFQPKLMPFINSFPIFSNRFQVCECQFYSIVQKKKNTGFQAFDLGRQTCKITKKNRIFCTFSQYWCTLRHIYPLFWNRIMDQKFIGYTSEKKNSEKFGQGSKLKSLTFIPTQKCSIFALLR